MATDHEDAVFEAATRWLRALLVPPVSPASKVLEPLVQAPKKRRAWWQRTWRDVEVTGNATALPLVASRDDEFVRRARQDLEVALDGALESRLLHVCGVFGLSEFERDILILLLLHAINTEIARLCSAMPDSDLDEESGRDAPCRGIRNPPAGRPTGTVAPRASSLRPCGRRR